MDELAKLEDCICDLKGIDRDTAALWNDTPHALGCPYHGPPHKMYCRKHHNGFYGSCAACRYDDSVYRLDAQIKQIDLLLGLVADLSWRPDDQKGVPEDSSEA